MNSKAIAVCFILSVAACDDKLSPRRHEFLQRQLPISGMPETPSCGSCDTGVISDEFLAALKLLGPGYERVKSIAANLRASPTNNIQETQENIAKGIQDLQDTLTRLLDELSAAAASMNFCPALKTFFDNFSVNMKGVFKNYIQTWPLSVKGTDGASITGALENVVKNSIRMLLTIYRDMMFNTVQLTPLCRTLAPIIYIVLDPQGIGANLISLLMSSDGDFVTAFTTSAFGSLIPGNQAIGGSLDIFEVLPILSCAVLSAAVVGVDLGVATGGYCPAGLIGGNFDAVGLLKEILCRFFSIIDPSATNVGRVCAPGSSQGGSSAGSQDLVTGLLCVVLNLLGFGGLLGCSSSGGSSSGGSDAVQVLTGLICELLKAMASAATGGVGIPIPFCPLG